ncbi:MAG: ribosome-associated translation inhibitor RaiA [Bacillales bacterium]|nr:ribosome-associated translation inhibitor RaiA [Bacillales bacterium]
MKLTVRGNKLEVTDSIRNYVEEKLGKLDKYFEEADEINANVLFRIQGKNQIVEVTVPIKKYILRAEEANEDLYASIDLVVEKLERQIRKNKTRIKERKVKDIPVINFEAIIEEEPKTTIVKRKSVEMKPMDEEEAVLQMELLGHEFFVFQDIDTDSISVLYKRKDGNYGIIETK